MADKMKRLKLSRGGLKSDITRFETFLNKISESTPIEQIQARLDAILPSREQFRDIQLELDMLTLDPEESVDDNQSSDIYEEFESKYFNAISRAQSIINKSNSAIHNSTVNSIPSSTNTTLSAKLPPLKLVDFTGLYSEWRKFHDTFRALVHANNTLTNIEKFYYLQASLKAEAAQVIASLPITESNYETAWSLLTERYENPKAISNSHISDILNLPSINKESHILLRSLLDGFLKNFRALELIDSDVVHWNAILIHILISKLDINSRREWENYSKGIPKPIIKDFTTFLSQRCSLLESLPGRPIYPNQSNSQNRACHLALNRSVSCPLCSKSHQIYQCYIFKSLTSEQRYQRARDLNLCTNCLRSGHRSNDCKSSNCRVCNKKHNSLLHYTSGTSLQDTAVDCPDGDLSLSNQTPEKNEVHSHYSEQCSQSFVILSTAIVNVFDKYQQPFKCRVILDSGSQANFVTSNLVTKLKLDTESIEMPVSGINQIKTKISKKVMISFSSVDHKYKAKLSSLVLDKITNVTPQTFIDIATLNIPSNIVLADSKFNEPQDIDMLIGASTFFDLLSIGQIKLGKHMPILQKTRLGWIVSGEISMRAEDRVTSNAFLSNLELSNQIQNFWKIEEVSENRASFLTPEEQECEDHFRKNISRTDSGRFVVKLPTKDNYTELGNSEGRALRRFHSLEQTFYKNPVLKEGYSKFLKEYHDLGHMCEAAPISDSNTIAFYLPHHAVEKPDSTSTKLRVVFDASAKTTSNMSLNDVLKVGPTVQEDLFSILLRFRKHKYVWIGDIAKMYRQILVHPSQRDLQRIVWRESADQKIKHFILNTVTYGTASAAFLATRCLKQIASDVQKEFVSESQIIGRDFYVDDLLTGADTIEELKSLKNNITNILKDYGFELTKFKSNILLTDDSNSDNYTIPSDIGTKTLGVTWIPSSDMFEYNYELVSKTIETKRSILSFIGKIFDPLGLLGPFIINAKIFMQKLWQANLQWDESLPLSLHSEWLSISEQFSKQQSIKIPRKIISDVYESVQLHGFCDASEKAYGCAVYIRSYHSKGSQCQLLCAKSRVAPLKTVSIPRLELCGALLLAQLVSKCVFIINLKIANIFLWCDSTIVLAWISREPKTWKTFVANRVSEIHSLSDIGQWHHITSGDNPADLLSRGINLTELSQSNLYWSGPQFLNGLSKENPDCAKPGQFAYNADQQPEFRKQISSLVILRHPANIIDFKRFSNINRLVRAMMYCFRFINNCRASREQRITSSFTSEEIIHAENVLIKFVQIESFPNEIQRLQHGFELPNNSKLRSLAPFLDEHNILRVGGRLRHSELNFNQKHPILLPHKHIFTQLIIAYEHERSFHSGTQNTLSHVRQKYWPINAKSAVKQVIKKCIKCFRVKPSNLYQRMGDLPPSRVTISRPFLSCGVDYAGPFNLKDGKLRNRSLIKGYICVFVCMSTKALHIELVTDLSSDGFAGMLRRFVSRRGLCRDIYSDNATNFVGFNNELVRIQSLIENDKIQYFLNNNKINWNFIPPRSPHFGGLWEAAIKSIKYHLKRLLTNQPLTYEEFYTLLTQTEAILNSRPLCPLTTDPNDFEALTPGHFIIGEALTAIPEADPMASKINYTKRHQYIQRLRLHFWKRWSHDYLHQLHQRTKWYFDKKPELCIGALVVLHRDDAPPIHWQMGRIVSLHPGQDGRVRVVSVKTAAGVIKRSIVKLSILPIPSDQDDVTP